MIGADLNFQYSPNLRRTEHNALCRGDLECFLFCYFGQAGLWTLEDVDWKKIQRTKVVRLQRTMKRLNFAVRLQGFLSLESLSKQKYG